MLQKRLFRNSPYPMAGGGLPKIDWTNPLTTKLKCFIYEGIGGIPIDLVTNTILTPGSAAPPKMTRFGYGINSAASNGGASMLLPKSMQFTGPVSLFYRGIVNTSATVSTCLMGTSYTNSDSSPYVGYQLGIGGSTNAQLQFNYNNAGGFAFNVGANVYPSSFTELDFLLTANSVTGGLIYYQNGRQIATASTSFAGSATYAATCYLQYASNLPYITNRHAGGIAVCGAMWNRVLTPGEAKIMHDDPYSFLIFPTDYSISLKNSAVVFTASLALVQPTQSTSITCKEIFRAALALIQGTQHIDIEAKGIYKAALALVQHINGIDVELKEKFTASLGLIQPAQTIDIEAHEVFRSMFALVQEEPTIAIDIAEVFKASLNLTQPDQSIDIMIGEKFIASFGMVQPDNVVDIEAGLIFRARFVLEQPMQTIDIEIMQHGASIPGICLSTPYSAFNIDSAAFPAFSVRGRPRPAYDVQSKEML